MPKKKSTLKKAKKLYKSIPAGLRRKAGTTLAKKALGKGTAKKAIKTGRAVRRATGLKFV